MIYLLGLTAAGILFILLEMVNAPRGYQDENGFHFLNKGSKNL